MQAQNTYMARIASSNLIGCCQHCHQSQSHSPPTLHLIISNQFGKIFCPLDSAGAVELHVLRPPTLHKSEPTSAQMSPLSPTELTELVDPRIGRFIA